VVVSEFDAKLEDNLLELRNDLLCGHYQHGGYQSFFVQDTKKRMISAPSVRDHIVHQAIYNILYKFYDKLFCFASFSCRNNRGLHLALNSIQRYLWQFKNRDCWVLHGDIKKCFDSINHYILKQIISERINCVKTICILDKIINSYSINTFGCGIPLGNLTSQLFINIYLNRLDEYVKERLKIKRYIRYADDFYCFCDTKKDCSQIAEDIRNFLKQELSLDFPLDHQQIRHSYSGVPALGQIFFPRYSKTNPRTFKRMMYKFDLRLVDYYNQEISAVSLNSSFQSFKGALKRGENYNYKRGMLNKTLLPFSSNLLQ